MRLMLKQGLHAPAIEVRASPISGRGVFTLRALKKGQVVLKWQPVARLNAAEVAARSPAENHFISVMPDGVFLLMGEPERFVNHSWEPNTAGVGLADVTTRDIEAGEEITGDYAEAGALVGFRCSCSSTCCRGWVGPTTESL